jgi:hypothetical protein
LPRQVADIRQRRQPLHFGSPQSLDDAAAAGKDDNRGVLLLDRIRGAQQRQFLPDVPGQFDGER